MRVRDTSPFTTSGGSAAGSALPASPEKKEVAAKIAATKGFMRG
jgi:hypothetical protein